MKHVAIDGMLVRKGASGVETTTYGLARALARHGTLRYTFFMREASPLPDIRSANLETVRCRIPCNLRILRLLHQQLILPRHLKQRGVDLLHCPGYLSPVRSPVPVVLHIHDLFVYSHPRLCRRATVFNYRLQMPGAVRRASRILTPSNATCDELLRRFPHAAGKTRVLPMAVDEAFVPAANSETQRTVREKYALPDSFILFVGQIEPKKNVPGLIRAFCELRKSGWRKHHLVVAGNPGWEAVDPLRLAADLGCADSVHVKGFIPREDLPGLYRAADLFVFPSLCEGFGLPPLEAMACGVPTVVSDRGSLPEVVGPGVPTVDPLDHGAMAEQMKLLLTDGDIREKVVQAGLAQSARFSWEKYVDHIEKMYIV